MKTKVAQIGGGSLKNSAFIFYYEIKGKSYWNVENSRKETTHSLCDSFDQAVKYACEQLGFIDYIK